MELKSNYETGEYFVAEDVEWGQTEIPSIVERRPHSIWKWEGGICPQERRRVGWRNWPQGSWHSQK